MVFESSHLKERLWLIEKDKKANDLTFSNEYPFGLYPYGFQTIIDKVKQQTPNILSKLSDDNFITESYCRDRMEYSLNILQQKEFGCTFQFSEWIKDNYMSHMLFNTVNHPSDHLLIKIHEMWAWAEYT